MATPTNEISPDHIVDAALLEQAISRADELLELLADVEEEHAWVLARRGGRDPEVARDHVRTATDALELARGRVVADLAAARGAGAVRASAIELARAMAGVLSERAALERELDRTLGAALEDEASAWHLRARALALLSVHPPEARSVGALQPAPEDRPRGRAPRRVL